MMFGVHTAAVSLNMKGSIMTRWLGTLLVSRLTVAIVAVALAVATNAAAHHSTTYFSKDLKDVVKIQGKVVRWEFRSPHSQVYVETKDARGDVVVWRFDTTPAAWLVREGWTKESLAVGDIVTAEGFPIPGMPYAWLGKITKQDGTRLLPQRSTATPPGWVP
jgi:hypothetical protein